MLKVILLPESYTGSNKRVKNAGNSVMIGSESPQILC